MIKYYDLINIILFSLKIKLPVTLYCSILQKKSTYNTIAMKQNKIIIC